MKTFLKFTAFSAVLLFACLPQAGAHQDNQDYARPPAVTVDSTFQLSSFILPDFRRRSLAIDGGLRNDFNSENMQNNDLPDAWTSFLRRVERETLNNNFQFNASAAFSDIHYTRNRQRETHISTSMNTGFNTENTWFQESFDDSVSVMEKRNGNTFRFFQNAQFRQVNRRYVNENWFFEYNPRIIYWIDFRNERNEQEFFRDWGWQPPTHEKSNHRRRELTQNVTAEISLGVGIGRIKPVGDARHAIHILDALARWGITSATKSAEEITRFAEFIAGLKNKRFLDARHRRIYELEAIDSFLLANDFRDTLSMEYFATLQDFWIHGNENRASGWRLSFHVTPTYFFRPQSNKGWLNGDLLEDRYRSENSLNTNLAIRFNHERPINLYWQNSFDASVGYTLLNTRELERNNLIDERFTRYPTLQGFTYSLNQRISYFPTTRTSAFASAGFSHSFSSNRTWFEETIHNLHARISAGATYFISPQLQISLDVGGEYRWFNTDRVDVSSMYSSRFSFGFDLAVRYTFF